MRTLVQCPSGHTLTPAATLCARGCDVCAAVVGEGGAPVPHLWCPECDFHVCDNCEVAAPWVRYAAEPSARESTPPLPMALLADVVPRPPRLDEYGRYLVCPDGHFLSELRGIPRRHAAPPTGGRGSAGDDSSAGGPNGDGSINRAEAAAAAAAATDGSAPLRGWVRRCDLCLEVLDPLGTSRPGDACWWQCRDCDFAVCGGCCPGYRSTIVQMRAPALHDHTLAFLRGDSLFVSMGESAEADAAADETVTGTVLDDDAALRREIEARARGRPRNCGACGAPVTSGQRVTSHGLLRRLPAAQRELAIPDAVRRIPKIGGELEAARTPSSAEEVKSARRRWITLGATPEGSRASFRDMAAASRLSSGVFGCPTCQDYFLCGACSLLHARDELSAEDGGGGGGGVQAPPRPVATVKVTVQPKGRTGAPIQLTAQLRSPPEDTATAAEVAWAAHDALHGAIPAPSLCFDHEQPFAWCFDRDTKAVQQPPTAVSPPVQQHPPSLPQRGLAPGGVLPKAPSVDAAPLTMAQVGVAYEPLKRLLLRQVFARHAATAEFRLKCIWSAESMAMRRRQVSEDLSLTPADFEAMTRRLVPAAYWIGVEGAVGNAARALADAFAGRDARAARAELMDPAALADVVTVLVADAVEEQKRRLAAMADGGRAAASDAVLEDLLELEEGLVEGIGPDGRFSGGDVTHYAPYATKPADIKPPFEHWIGDPGTHARPYYCPHGWSLLRLPEASAHQTPEDWSEHVVAYHGTNADTIPLILKGGFRPATDAAGSSGKPTVYMSPSVAYAAHPRYAKPVSLGKTKCGKEVWGQAVIACAVHQSLIYQTQGETMTVNGRAVIDWQYPLNKGLELLVRAPPRPPPAPPKQGPVKPQKAVKKPNAAAGGVAAAGKKRKPAGPALEANRKAAAPKKGPAAKGGGIDDGNAPEDPNHDAVEAARPAPDAKADAGNAEAPAGALAGHPAPPMAVRAPKEGDGAAPVPPLPPPPPPPKMVPGPGHLGEDDTGKLRVLGVMVRVSTELGAVPDAHWWGLFWDVKAYASPPFHN